MTNRILSVVYLTILLSMFVFGAMGAMRVVRPESTHCKVYENIVRTDSTYYEVQCGHKAKIKSIIETL